MTKLTHDQLKKAALSKASVKKEFDSLKEEFDLLSAMIKARKIAGKTQNEVAKKMNTSTSVVGRLETGGGSQKHSPTYALLRKYAHAVNCNLEVRFVSRSKSPVEREQGYAVKEKEETSSKK